jgi:hypothetical protein
MKFVSAAEHVYQLSMCCAAPEHEAGKQMLLYTLLGANRRKGNHFSKSFRCQLVTRKKQNCRDTVSDSITSVTVPHRHSALGTKTSRDSTKHSNIKYVHATPLNITAFQGHIQREQILLVAISEVIQQIWHLSQLSC